MESKNTLIILIAVIAAVMLVGALAITTTTHSVYAWTNANGDFKGGIRHPGQNACENEGTTNNPNCQ